MKKTIVPIDITATKQFCCWTAGVMQSTAKVECTQVVTILAKKIQNYEFNVQIKTKKKLL